MIRENKWKLIISTVMVLLPIVIGAAIWDILPERLAIHWGVDGTADGWGSRYTAVVLPSCIMLVAHFVCILACFLDPKNKGQSKKALGLVIWVCPAVSVYTGAFVYASALGMEFGGGKGSIAAIGLMFAVIGNYLPKCRQNNTIGIKIKWALENEENWNATHRFGGKVWLIGGLVLIASTFLPVGLMAVVLIVLITVMAVIPIIYSYVYHRKQLREGTAEINAAPTSPQQKIISRVAFVFVAVVIIFVVVMLVTGNVEVSYDDSAFTIEADYWDDRTVEYSDIESIEYREENDVGIRTNGFGSPRLLMGTFENEEFGSYTRYSYTKCENCVVLTIGERVLVLSGRDEAGTKQIYEELTERMK